MTERKLKTGGATVTINPDRAPSVVMSAAEQVVVTDGAGRSITLKKPGILAQFRLVEALGDIAMNQAYMGMVLPLLFVTMIDGEAVASPGSKGELEALLKRLDEDGYQAVALGIQQHFSPPTEDGAKNG